MTNQVKVFVPSDTTARSIGADGVAAAIAAEARARNVDITLVRNGSCMKCMSCGGTSGCS